MCNCGCEDNDGPADLSSPNIRSLPGANDRGNGRRPMASGKKFVNARRVLTYDEETNDLSDDCSDDISEYSPAYSSPAQPKGCPDRFQDLEKFLTSTGTKGIAIVQRQTTNDTNGTSDYAGDVQRQNPKNDDSGKSRKFRAALPPRGPTPCCPSKESSYPQARGCDQDDPGY